MGGSDVIHSGATAPVHGWAVHIQQPGSCDQPRFPSVINESPVSYTREQRSPGVNLVGVIHRSSHLFNTVDNGVDNSVGRAVPLLALLRLRCYFHCVETTNPPAIKPKPTTMFQLPSAWMGRLPCVT
jgi:hypothetical protein